MNELILEIKWENNNKFEVTSTRDGGSPITILTVEENGCIAELWAGIEGLMHTFLTQQLKHIGEEMKA